MKTVISMTSKGNKGSLKATIDENGKLIEGSIAPAFNNALYGKSVEQVNRMSEKFQQDIEKEQYFNEVTK